MIPLEIQHDGNKPNAQKNNWTIVAFPKDNFYHSKCGKKIFGSKAEILSNLFQTKSKKRVLMLIASVFIPWIAVIVIQSIYYNYFYRTSPVLDAIHNFLWCTENFIPSLGQLLFIFSFNTQLVKYQLSQFEVLYKFYLCITCASAVLLMKSIYNTSTPWQKLNDVIYGISVATLIALSVFVATCADAVKTHYISKIYISLIAIVILLATEVEYIILRWSYSAFYQITIFGIILNGFDIIRHGIETLIIFFVKELIVQIYTYKIQKQDTKAVVIKTNAIIDWYAYDSCHHENENKISLLDNDYNHNCNHSNSQSSCSIKDEIAETCTRDNNNNKFVRCKVHMDQDFYHTDCMIKVLKLPKSFADRMSKIFQSEKILVVGFIVLAFYFSLFIISFINNQKILYQYRAKDSLENVCDIIRVLILIIFQILTILSFNVKLFKLQFENFETIYKLSNTLIIIICEMIYIANNSGYKNAFIDEKQMLIARNVLYFICIFIAVVGVSCIDAWCIDIIYKKLSLICLVMGLIYWFIITVYQRSYQDYPYLNPKINIYYTQRSAFAALIIFSLKNLLLLIYYNCKGCRKKVNYNVNGTMTTSPTMMMKKCEQAISPFDNPTILWVNRE